MECRSVPGVKTNGMCFVFFYVYVCMCLFHVCWGFGFLECDVGIWLLEVGFGD